MFNGSWFQYSTSGGIFSREISVEVNVCDDCEMSCVYFLADAHTPKLNKDLHKNLSHLAGVERFDVSFFRRQYAQSSNRVGQPGLVRSNLE